MPQPYQPTDPLNGFVANPFPISKGDEYSYTPYEWLRQRIYLLFNPGAGMFNDVDDLVDKNLAEYEAYCDAHSGSDLDAGQWLLKFYGVVYTNVWPRLPSTGTFGGIKAHPPTTGGVLNSGHWRRYFDYDKYHEADLNSALGEDTDRYRVHRRTLVTAPYEVILPAANWLPRQFHPFEQIRPLLSKSQSEREYTNTEILNANYITGDINTNYTRTWATPAAGVLGYKSEYLKSEPEPNDSIVGSQDYYDPKMGSGYQAMVIAAIENAGNQYVAKVDSDWVTRWEDRPTNYAKEWNDHTQYNEYDPVASTGPSVVWNGLDGSGRIIVYTCIKTHNPSPYNDPHEPPDAEYWESGEWHPDKYEHVPYYTYYGYAMPGVTTINETVAEADAWGENNSAFEKCLNDIGYYDWWWDASHQYIPQWLAYRRSVSGDPNTNWPLPIGCWRKCFRYSMGKPNGVANNMLWPGKWVWDDPEDVLLPRDYEQGYLLITQAQWDAMPAANRHFYKIGSATAQIESTYSGLDSGLKAALEARHNPVQYQYRDEDKYPEYEIFYEMLNDMYLVLNELQYYNGESSFNVTVKRKTWNLDGEGASPKYSSASAACSAGKAAMNAVTPTHVPTTDWWCSSSPDWVPNGYCIGVWGRYGVGSDPDYYQYGVEHMGNVHECETWDGFAKIVTAIWVEFVAEASVGLHNQRLLLRCAWCGMDGDESGERDYGEYSKYFYSGATIKVLGEDVTESPVDNGNYEGRYGSQYLDMAVDEQSYFETQIVSSSPSISFVYPEAGMDWIFNEHFQWLMVKAKKHAQHLYLIVVADWSNYVALNVFDLDWTNAV